MRWIVSRPFTYAETLFKGSELPDMQKILDAGSAQTNPDLVLEASDKRLEEQKRFDELRAQVTEAGKSKTTEQLAEYLEDQPRNFDYRASYNNIVKDYKRARTLLERQAETINDLREKLDRMIWLQAEAKAWSENLWQKLSEGEKEG